MSAAVAPAVTIGELLTAAINRLAASGGIVEPRRDARLILSLGLGVDPAVVMGWPEREVGAEAVAVIEGLIARRERGEPFSRLRGKREFWSLDFALSPETLDPRPDSETLIVAALDDIRDRNAPLRIVDFGTGTGCLLLALLSELPQAQGIGIDIQPGAVATARANAAALGLGKRAEFRLGSWDLPLKQPADVILSNPPYIPTEEIERLAPEVALFDPLLALDGGPDGLRAYRFLGAAIRSLLSPGGRAYIEIGTGQEPQVARIFTELGLQIAAVRADLAGIERCVVATR
jgi:release factor glutamine methyltransferase